MGGTILLVGWGLWPLASKDFAIEFDQQKMEATKAFLTENVQRSDSISPPNIIILLADDLGYHDLSMHGNNLVNTKHIDAFAKAGITCTKAYVSSPVCSPSRAGIITGRYQQRFGLGHQIQERYLKNRMEYWGFKAFVHSKPWSIKKMNKVPRKKDKNRQGLPPTEITLAEILKKQGYHTALMGKWHLGISDYSLPHKRGFDEHYGFYNSHSLFAPEGTPGIVDMRNPQDWTDQHIWASQRKGRSAIVRNGKVIKESKYLTDRITEESIAFMEKHQADPFFLLVSFSTPHTPFQVPQSYYDQFDHIDDPVKRTYNAMIASLDDAVGAITNRVESLGLSENTLLFFLSDNGAAAYTLAVDNCPLKGGKITNFEGGLRIPFMAKWKGVLLEGQVFEQPVSALDVFTTACAVAGAVLPVDRIYDGVNLIPHFTQVETKIPHETLYWEVGINRIILHQQWKLFFNKEDDKQTLLYNLETDPFEKMNLTAEYPQKVKALKKIHQNWSAELPPPLWPPLVNFSLDADGNTYYFDL